VSRRVETVAVVGREAPAWLAAAALRRALGPTGVRVQVVDLGTRLTPADAYAAIPTIGAMHRLLGVDERLVLDACAGVPMVGQRFSNWAASAPPFVLGYDDEPPPGGDLPTGQYWAKGALSGLRVGLEDFSLGSACARLGRVPIAGLQASPVSASYGYHLDALSYSELLKQIALRMGVEEVPARLRSVDCDDSRIAGLELDDGSRIEADFYIDASGQEAVLLAGLGGAEFEPWSEWLQCDRLLAASGPRLQSLPAFSQISAFPSGWAGLFPLRNRTAVVAAYKSGSLSDREVAEQAAVIARMPIGEAVVSELRPGIQRRAWIGNCVAVGASAIAPDPLCALELHVVHGCVSHLMTLFPATADEFPEAEAYNRSIGSFGSNLRDFQIAPYALNKRFDDPFWDRVRDAPPPPSLERRTGLFQARATVPLNDDESFYEQGWATMFAGLGLTPRDYDPRIDSLADEALMQKVQQRLREVAAIAGTMPTGEQFLGLDQPRPVGVSR
jgi:tryptophan 7-halogenase